MIKKLLFLLSLLSTGTSLLSQDFYIHCREVFDPNTMEFMEEVTIVVEGERIAGVKNGYLKVENDGIEIIDLKDQTVLPGLFDMHVHVESQSAPDSYLKRFTTNSVEQAFACLPYAKTTLMAGFTTVRDLGGSGINIALRDAIADGSVIGPRIFTAGKSIATTGGHADPTNGYRRELMPDAVPKDGVADGPAQCAEAVRWRYKNGADCIKITGTGGVLSMAKSGDAPQFSDEELRAIVETANDYGFHVAVHAHGAEGMKRAVLAGVTSIEHGTKMTDEVMDLMKEYNCYLVPTITAGKAVAEKAEIIGYYPEVIRPKALEIGPMIQNTFAKAYKKGVPIAFGTDAGVFDHGTNWKEFVYMTEAGMPLKECLQTATIIPAKILGVEDELGSIEASKLADIIAIQCNSAQELIDRPQLMEKVAFVMKEGTIYRMD